MVNREIINDRFKLACHRIVARQLITDPGLLEKARQIVEQWATHPVTPDFVSEWQAILRLPIEEIRRVIIGRNDDLTRLRISSPFLQLMSKYLDDEHKKRLWRIVKRSS